MEYQALLAVAVDAARAAGDRLRRDFHAPGGARGGGNKAPADTEAEIDIRRRLETAWPDAGYVGEETGRRPGGQGGHGHVWLVDPNDGTRAYLEGHRGSAVSIALLRNGIPVLGVVFAFSAPDDTGDLFAWAEQCGPLQRNGRAIGRPPWPPALDSRSVVLHSHTADRRPEGNAGLTLPARYRAVPSIAYRLALVAAGEACAAVSLNGPGAWDYAAGHALLRAAGGAFVDQDGHPVTYTPDGQSQVQFCFGGAPAIVRELRHREWTRVLDQPRTTPAYYDLVWPARGQHVESAGRLMRGQGCLLGHLAGDALGSQVEFEAAAAIRTRHPDGVRHLADGGCWDTIAGQPTDDGELTLMLARAIDRAGAYDAEAAATAYAHWFRSQPFDCGMTTRQALGAIKGPDLDAGHAAARAREHANRESQANGALMRIGPLALLRHGASPEDLAEEARMDAQLTHPHQVCQDANAVYAVAIAYAIDSGASPQEVYGFTARWAAQHGIAAAVIAALERATAAAPADVQSHQGWVLVAFQHAFHQLLRAPSLEEGLVRTVMAGGDTDTNAAVAGALLGAVYGRDAVPLPWRQLVLSCRPIEGLPGVRRPRARCFWPVDVLTLAERLLDLGSQPEEAA
jgi:ADP-ribosylglycohydrolase/fructose-1,6-bisphosphatase/inositol monophosphatase family enzyme